MCSMGISCLNWNFLAAPKLASESAWLFANLGTYLKSHRGILDFNLRTSCRYSATRESLATYSSPTWMTTNEESRRTSSPVTLRVIAVRSLTKTASYSTSLLDAGKPRVKDYSMMNPSGVVRTIPMPAPLLFEAPLTFRTHPSSWSEYSMVPRVKSAMKSSSTWPLNAILSSYLSL